MSVVVSVSHISCSTIVNGIHFFLLLFVIARRKLLEYNDRILIVKSNWWVYWCSL